MAEVVEGCVIITFGTRGGHGATIGVCPIASIYGPMRGPNLGMPMSNSGMRAMTLLATWLTYCCMKGS